MANASPIQNVQNLTSADQLSFSGYSNATEVLLSVPDPVLSDTQKQQMLEEAMNVPGIKAWSSNWKFLTMDFIGNYSSGTWQYAVVRLQLSSSDAAPFYCQYGWGAFAKIDLNTKNIVLTEYPTMKDHLCNVIISGPPNDDKLSPSLFYPAAFATAGPPNDPSFAIVQQYDVSSNANKYYGNKAVLTPPYHSLNIFSDMSPNSVIEQLLNADWNVSCNSPSGYTPDCFTQSGWVITNYDCGSECNYITAKTEDLIYVDQSTTSNYNAQNTLLNVASGYTETVQITCNPLTLRQEITILYTYQSQIFHHTTNIQCAVQVYQTSNINRNSIFFENWNEEPSANWANDVLSSIVASNALEYDSNGNSASWSNSYNVDYHNAMTIPDLGSLVLTDYLSSGGTTTWSNLSIMPTYASPCAPTPSGWTISYSCVLTHNNSMSGDVTVSSGKVLIIPSGITLTMPFSTHKITVTGGGTVLIELGGTISS
jgi:hypothetical protein